MLTLVLVVVLAALVFEFINGFHDTANSIATVVATKVLSPGQAVILAASMNLIGAFMGTAVAKTIASGLIDTDVVDVTSQVILCALLGGIVWNLITWWRGLPSSSSHALIGGLCGAALAAAHNNWHALIWSQSVEPTGPEQGPAVEGRSCRWSARRSPGFLLGVLIMVLLYAIIAGMARSRRPAARGWRGRAGSMRSSARRSWRRRPTWASRTAPTTRRRPWASSRWRSSARRRRARWTTCRRGWRSCIRTAARTTSTAGSSLTCALVMAAGTAAGGWRIIKTLGHKMVKLHPIHGFAAETASATILVTAAHFGMPVSTTHSISTAIMGVGFAKNSARAQADGDRADRLGVDPDDSGGRRHRLRAAQAARGAGLGLSGSQRSRSRRPAHAGLRLSARLAARDCGQSRSPPADSIRSMRSPMPPISRIRRSTSDGVEAVVRAVLAQLQVGHAVEVADGEVADAAFPVEGQRALARRCRWSARPRC